MLFTNIFLSAFWVSAILIIWFLTDWFLHYSQLFNIFKSIRLRYTSLIKKEPSAHFTDFLFLESLKTKNRWSKFALKMATCPLCLAFWLSVLISLSFFGFITIAPTYVLSLALFSLAKKFF